MVSSASTRPNPRRLRVALLACLGALALVAAACGDDDSGDKSAESKSTASTTEAAEETTTTAAESLADLELEETFWFGSFEAEISNGRVELDEATDAKMIRFDISLDNLSESRQTFRASEAVLWSGEDESVGSPQWDGDSVEPGGRSSGTLSFDLSDFETSPTVEDLELRFGADTDNQVLLPLSGDDPVTLEPTDVPMADPVVAGVFTFDLMGGTIQYNDVARNGSLEKDSAWLYIGMDVSLAAGDHSGSRSVPVSDWRVELPSGSTVALEDSEGFQSMKPGTDLKGLSVVIPIEMPVDGDYTMTVFGSNEANEVVETPYAFKIEASAADDSSDTEAGSSEEG